MPEDSIEHIDFDELNKKAISQPLITHMYTADPSVHVWDGKIYIYPSHDIDAGLAFDDDGGHFGMVDYHAFTMDSPAAEAKDHGEVIHVKDVKWAEKQMWDCDVARKDGKYYMYFPAKKADGIFQIGVAISDSPTGPFIPQDEPMKGSYSIDPCVFEDEDGSQYMYFGGIWGGQLQKYRDNKYDAVNDLPKTDEASLCPKIAKIADNMLEFAETPKDILILDENGNPILEGDNDRRFFEASWMFRKDGKYHFTYSTGDTHFICYATGDNPYGPFTYTGRILNPVVGWTTHHAIIEFGGKWYLYYHDSSLSKGVTHLRSMKMTELEFDSDGKIKTIDPYIGLQILD